MASIHRQETYPPYSPSHNGNPTWEYLRPDKVAGCDHKDSFTPPRPPCSVGRNRKHAGNRTRALASASLEPTTRASAACEVCGSDQKAGRTERVLSTSARALRPECQA